MLQKYLIVVLVIYSIFINSLVMANESDEHFYDQYYFQYAKFVDCTAVVFEKGDDEVVICEYTITIGNVTKSILRELTQSDVERIFNYEDTNE
jgi:hypothetical protein